MDADKIRTVLEVFRPDTDNLIVIGIIAYLMYATYMGSDVVRLADTAIGILGGYLGASTRTNAKVNVPKNPPDLITK